MKKNKNKPPKLDHSEGLNPQPCVSEFTVLPSSPSYSLTANKKLNIKGKPCPETHNFKILGVRWEPWTFGFPVFHSST